MHIGSNYKLIAMLKRYAGLVQLFRYNAYRFAACGLYSPCACAHKPRAPAAEHQPYPMLRKQHAQPVCSGYVLISYF